MRSNNPAQDHQWHAYKQLELIPDSTPNPHDRSSCLFGADLLWRTLISLLVDELVETDQKVEYLERCCAASAVEQSPSAADTLKRLWVLMN